MTYKNQLINGLKQGFLFYAFSTILIAIQFGFYIVGSPVLDYMDFEGWVFFAASCVRLSSCIEEPFHLMKMSYYPLQGKIIG